MSRSIIKLTHDGKDYYLEWSSVIDAPVTYGMTLEEFKAYYREEYGRKGMEDLDQRLTRVEASGTSHALFRSVDDEIANNRAGENCTCLTKDQLIEVYVVCSVPSLRGKENNDDDA